MFGHRVRLNVGQVEVLTLYSDEIRALFRAPLNTNVDRRFSVDFDAARPVYPAVPVSSGVFRCAPADLTDVPRTFWSAHEAFIEAAAEAKRVSPFKKSFSDGVLTHLEGLLGSALPRPSYLAARNDTGETDNWRAAVRQWLRKSADSSDDLPDSVVRFFERAFENTRFPEQAWFGVHRTRVSLVVGGIFLAAVLRTGKDRGFWLLVDQQPPPVEGVKYHPAKSTTHKRSKFPLVWAHSPSLNVIRGVTTNDEVWESFLKASEKILQAGIATGRDDVQERRGKIRLSEMWKTSPDARVEPVARTTEPRLQVPMGAGFGDPEQNRKVEQAAVQIVAESYRKEGWQVTSVEAQRCGFDLLCRRDGTEAHVEVKGAAGSERRFIVTAGELRHATDDDRFVLALVTNALTETPTLEHWPAPSFHDQFAFEPIQYWAVSKAKRVATSPNKPIETDAKRGRGSSPRRWAD
jgi:hypothetical protein